MRKSLLLCFVLFLLAAVCLLSVSASEKTVFLSSGATGTGASASDPIGTLANAYAALGDEGGTIVFINEYPFSVKADLPAHTGKITWTSVYGDTDYRESGAALKWTKSVRIGMGGPTEIDRFHFIDAGNGVLAANFHDLTIGEDVSFTDASGNAVYKTAVMGGPNIDTTVPVLAAGESSTLTIKSGTYLSVTAFSNNVADRSHQGTVTVDLSGDTAVKNAYLGARGTNAKGGTVVLNMTDSASITTSLCLANSTTLAMNGTVTVNLTGNASIAALTKTADVLHYTSTVTLPSGFASCFTSVTQTDAETPDEPETPTEGVVFLSAGASGTGATASDPIGTLAAAYAALGDEGGTVVLMNKYTLTARIDLPAHTGKITWTSVYGNTDYRASGATLYWAGSYRIGFGGPTEIDNFVFTDNGGGVLAANFHDLTIGKDVQTLNADGKVEAKTAVTGGPNVDSSVGTLDAGESSTLTIQSGTYKTVVAFSRAVANRSHNGTVTLNVGGNVSVNECFLGAHGTNAVGGTTVLNMTENAAIATLYLANNLETSVTNGTVTVNAHDYASIGETKNADPSLFVPENARTLTHALTASVPTDTFDRVSLTDVAYLTVEDETADGLSVATVDSIDVTDYVTEADGGITLPYPEKLTAFTLNLLYAGEVKKADTFAVTVKDGVASATLTASETFNGSTVYVRDGGTGHGFTPDTPTASLSAAAALLPEGGTVVITGELTMAKSTLPDHTGTLTVTSVYSGVDYRESGARLFFPTAVTLQLGGETVWKDISIHTTTYTVIAAAFHPITFDTGVTVTNDPDAEGVKESDSTLGLYIVGGYNRVSLGEVTMDKDSSITLKSGAFRRVWASDRLTGKTSHTGTATVVVEGDTWVDEVVVGASGNSATATNASLTLKDTAIIQNLYIGGKERDNYLTGTFDFVIYGGDIYEIDRCSLHTATGTQILTYDVSTAPEGYPYLAELAWFDVIQTFCERDNTHAYSEPYPSEFDANIQLKRCSICGDIQFVGDLPAAVDGNFVFVAEGGLGDGTHPSMPTSDLYAAFKKLENSGGTIVIMNAYTLVTNTKQKLGGAPEFFQEPLHKGAITVTSVYGETDYRKQGAKFIFDGNVDYKLGGPVIFDHIVFDATAEATQNEIVARYFPIVFGEDVEMLRDMDDSYRLNLIGGYKYFRYTDFTDVIVEDGLIEMVTPARILTADPETGDYTVNDPVNLVIGGMERTGFLRADAANAFNTMFADMAKLGLKEPTGIGYAWRGYHQQYDGYTRQLADYRINQNKTYPEAHNWVITHCSIPGASEHHLGYAFDFNDADIPGENPHFKYDTTEEWAWIMQNGYKYGLILRFTPKDKYVTGFIYEAWHFRYVGIEHATAIANLNSNGDPVANAEMLLDPEWCLEDYAGLVLGMYDLDSSVTVNGGTFASIEGGSVGCDDLPLTGENNVSVGEGATVKPTGRTYDLIFFSEGASGNGLSADSPVGTLAQAYAKLGEDGGTLVWMNEVSVGSATELPAHTGTVTVTSVYGGVDYRESGAALQYTAGIRVAFNGPTVIENFKFINGRLLCANFHPLTLGEGIIAVDANGANNPTITLIGGGNNNPAVGTLDAGETNTLTVKSGIYSQIVAFSAYNTNLSHTGTVLLTVSGDVSATSIYLGAKATGSCGGNTVLTLSGNASVGTLYLANESTAKTNGTVTVYAKDQSKIGTVSKYDPKYFASEEPRTLYYEATATLPTSLTTYFDRVILLDTIERTGDANGDGVLTLTDVIRALRASTDSAVEISMAADLNADGTITVVDALLIIKRVLQ